jgi:hypothetical protein
VNDGATHISTLHLDSFPIRTGWAEYLAGYLTEECPLVVTDQQITACLFFAREFWLQNRPKMRLSGDETGLSSFYAYLPSHHPACFIDDSGIGYAFATYSNGREWRSLSATAGKPGLGTIYEDTIYHLVGTTRVRAQVARVESSLSGARRRLAVSLVTAAWSMLPPAVMRLIRAKIRKSFDTGSRSVLGGPYTLDRVARLQRQDRAIRALAQDPDHFLAMLRRHAPPRL